MKVAYIDYTCGDGLMPLLLRERGLELVGAETLEIFLQKHNLTDFQALLYHPGVKQQHMVFEVAKRHPSLKIALVTFPTQGGDYPIIELHRRNILIFTYDAVDEIEKFVRGSK